MSTEKKYTDAFDEARARYRITGAGGVSLPNQSTPARPGAQQAESTPQIEASKNVIVKNGVVMIGGKNIKTKDQRDNTHFGIFDYGKKDTKNNGSDTSK
jgi:hypothetical protein